MPPSPQPALDDAPPLRPFRLRLRPYPHQVAGHTHPTTGAPDALTDDAGRFYKPLQGGGRGDRERAFYEGVAARAATDPFGTRAGPFLAALPRFYGTTTMQASPPPATLPTPLLVLEDVAAGYVRPCIVDIKIGHATPYPGASAADAAKWAAKDAATTQGVLGWKICGLQVWRRQRAAEEEEEAEATGGGASTAPPHAGWWWRPGKAWCKALTPATAVAALASSFAGDADPALLYGGPAGLAAGVRALAAWAERQTDFSLHSASVLLLYEGDATAVATSGLRPAVRVVDFAHSFITTAGAGAGADPTPPPPPAAVPHPSLVGTPDENFAAGLAALATALEAAAAGGGA